MKSSEPIWNLAQMTDPAFLDALIPQACDLQGTVILEMSDGRIRVSIRQAMLNLFWFPILTAFNIPLRKDHFVKYKPLNKGALADEWSRYYEEIMNQDQHNAKRLKQVMWTCMGKLYKFCCTNLLPYVASMDIVDMAEVMTDPPMKAILDTKEKIKPEWGTDKIEKFIDVHNKELMKLMGDPKALQNDVLYPYQSVGQLNKMQVPQMLYAFGVRTDVNDNIIGLPVIGSALDGLRDVKEYAVESLSAKKAMFYNKVAVRKSQYFGRKQHLLTSSIEHIYHGDCGTTKTISFLITEKNCDNLMGKYIYDHGKLVCLDKNNVRNYLNQVVPMRSALTCRYRRGVCEICGGKILRNVNRKLLLGTLSSIHTIEQITQKILSAKHLIKTLSLIYEVPPQSTKILMRTNPTEVRWQNSFMPQLKYMQMGIPTSDFKKVHDVLRLRSGVAISEHKFGGIGHIVLKNPKGEIQHYNLVDGEQRPFFSSEMLLFMRDQYDQMTFDSDYIWLPLAGSERKLVFKTTVINDNVLQFVADTESFLGSKLKDFNDADLALKEFSDMVYDKVQTSIMHIEIMLKAYLITSATDYRIPVVEDPHNVMFSDTHKILMERNVGVECGFQFLEKYVKEPSTYLRAKVDNPYDIMIGLLPPHYDGKE